MWQKKQRFVETELPVVALGASQESFVKSCAEPMMADLLAFWAQTVAVRAASTTITSRGLVAIFIMTSQ
jgi:hypothetical protein